MVIVIVIAYDGGVIKQYFNNCAIWNDGWKWIRQEEKGGEEGKESEARKDLRSKGLCLVPMELTVHVAETNGADFWSPAMVNKVSSNQWLPNI